MTALIPGAVAIVLVVGLGVELLLGSAPSSIRFLVTGIGVSAVLAHFWRLRRRANGAP